MPDIDETKIKNFLRESAARQMPDAWGAIERSISNMDNQTVKSKAAGKRFPLAAALAACAIVVLAAAAFAWPGFLRNKTDDTQIRQPVPFTDNASLTREKGPSLKIRFFETLKDLAADENTTDIAEFKFVRELGVTPSEDGMALYTQYELQAVNVYKGSLKPGDTIMLKTFGGAGNGKWVEDDYIERFTGKFGYVLFLGAPGEDGGNEYRLASPLQGYVPVLDGKVSLNTKIENNGLFQQGEKLKDLAARIKEALH